MSASTLISLCMIVKNEENNITRSLESVKKLVDEMVIIDTGSEDETVQKAKEFGAAVYYSPWQNDFSAARNYALTKAKGQWVLFLDADEVLGKISFNKFRKTLKSAKEEGFYLTVINYQGNNQGNFTKTYGLRLFRNNYLYRYEGKIHEQILPAIKRAKPQALIAWSQLVIHHYGYLEREFKEKNKSARNLEILLSESQEIKQSAFYCLNIAMEYLRIGKMAEAEAKLKEGWEKVNIKDSYAHLVLLKLIACLHWQKKNSQAIEFCRLGLKLYPDFSDIYYYYGICLVKVGDLLSARKVLLEGLSIGESSNKYISLAGCGSYLNLYTLGQIEEQCLNFGCALDYYLQALSLQPQNLKYLKGLIRVLSRCDLDRKLYLEENNLLTKEYYQTVIKTAFEMEDLVSIIIPVYNQLKYTKMCLDSVWQYTSGNYEIIVINNGSQDATKEYLEQIPHIKTVHNKENLGFAAAVNQGISIAKGNYIIILNNDCIVTEEWVIRLLRPAEMQDVGIVGVMSNFAASPQLFRASIDNIDSIPRIAQQVRTEYNQSFIYTNRVVGLCMLIKRELIEKIGGFDPRFGLGTFEDDDFSVRSILCGYKNVIAQDVFIFHFGSKTFKEENIDRNRLLRENWQKFKEKWGLPADMPLGTKDYLANITARDFNREDLYVPYESGRKDE